MARLDDDDGSESNPLPDTTKLVFADPATSDAVIAALVAEAKKQGTPSDIVAQFEALLKTTLPAVANIVLPGSGAVVTLVANAIP